MKKVILTLTIALISLFIIQSCKKEFNNSDTKSFNNIVKKIKFDDIQKNKRLATIINKINNKNIEINTHKNNNDLLDFIILTNEANLYIDNNGKYQYTFSVYRNHPIDTIQENVLLIIRPDQMAEAYLLRYHLTLDEFQNFINGQFQNNPTVDIIPIDYNMVFNKTCMISYESVFNVIYDDGCCQVIQYVGVNVTFTGDCGGTGAFGTINDFGNGYMGPPEGGGGAPFPSNINSYFSPNGILGLTQQQSDWINNNGLLKINLITYLNNHNFSQSARNFVKLIIQLQISNTNDINFDDCIIFRNMLSNNYPFFKNVFQEIDALPSNIIETSRNIFDSNQNISVLIDARDLNSNAAATTLPYQTINSQNLFITYFDTGILDKCTDIFAAATYIYERIHAILLYAAATNQISVTNLNSATFENLLNAYAEFIRTQNSTYNGLSHHNIIANYYINEIANALLDYGNSKGYSMNINYYKKLAWAGLTETNFFHTLYNNINGSLSNSGIDIIATILAEQNNQSFLGTNGTYYTP